MWGLLFDRYPTVCFRWMRRSYVFIWTVRSGRKNRYMIRVSPFWSRLLLISERTPKVWCRCHFPHTLRYLGASHAKNAGEFTWKIWSVDVEQLTPHLLCDWGRLKSGSCEKSKWIAPKSLCEPGWVKSGSCVTNKWLASKSLCGGGRVRSGSCVTTKMLASKYLCDAGRVRRC